MIRIFDLSLSILGLILLFPILVLIFMLGLIENGSPLFFQLRLGLHKKPFKIIKFRTMHKNTKSIPNHLVNPKAITKFGIFLRKYKLDELPQLWNVLKGQMSLVGPRPNLPNQIELILEREKRKIYDVKPGITGLAQIKKITMAYPIILADTDAEMVNSFTFKKYIKYIFQTLLGSGIEKII